MEKEFDKTADAQVWDSGSQKLRRDTEREAVLALTMITEQISQVCRVNALIIGTVPFIGTL